MKRFTVGRETFRTRAQEVPEHRRTAAELSDEKNGAGFHLVTLSRDPESQLKVGLEVFQQSSQRCETRQRGTHHRSTVHAAQPFSRSAAQPLSRSPARRHGAPRLPAKSRKLAKEPVAPSLPHRAAPERIIGREVFGGAGDDLIEHQGGFLRIASGPPTPWPWPTSGRGSSADPLRFVPDWPEPR